MPTSQVAVTTEVKNNLDASNQKSYWQYLAMNSKITRGNYYCQPSRIYNFNSTPEHSNI